MPYKDYETQSTTQAFNVDGTRYQSKALSLGSDLYVLGGIFASNNYSDCYKSTDSGVTWTQLATGIGFAHRKNAVCIHDSKLYVAAGATPSPVNSVYSSSNGSSWTANRANGAASGFTACGSPGLASYNGDLYLAGGYDAGGTPNNSVWKSTDGGAVWTQVTAAANWAARSDLALIVHDGKLWCLGGDNDAGTFYNDVWHTTDGATWTQATASAGWIGRRYPVAFSRNGFIYVGFGDQAAGDDATDLWKSTDGTTWTEVHSNRTFFDLKANSASGLVHSDGSIYIFAATDDVTPAQAGVWRSILAGTLAETNANDTLASSGEAINPAGTLAKTAANDTLAASGQTSTSGSLAETNADDQLHGVLYGTLNPPDPPPGDTVVAVGVADFRINTGSKVPYFYLGEDELLDVKYYRPIYYWESMDPDKFDNLGEDDLDQLDDEVFQMKYENMTKDEFVAWKKRTRGF